MVCNDSSKSSWKAVTSGVPQGSVLGPVLFLVFINDLDSTLISSTLKFADDTKLFGIVNTDVERAVIQRDLSCLVEWSEKWLMPFNTDKCVVLHLGKNTTNLIIMNSSKLYTVNEKKDLGVIITSNLKPVRECQQAYAKAIKSLGLIFGQ